ncbi:transferase, partial [Haloferax sp. Atlit-12N]
YLDLAQQEGSVDSSTALTMQLLISLVYERAKETDKEVVFVIDEARYIMQDAASLAFLETVFRHHRHHDLSIRLVTQTVDEFFEHAESEAILDQCAVKQFHRLDGMDKEWADEFGLNHAQMRYVQDAVPGNEDAGFSEALVGVDGEWRGIRVEAMPKETEVIDFDPTEQRRASLPGAGETAVSPEIEAFRTELAQQANGESQDMQTDSTATDNGQLGGTDDV